MRLILTRLKKLKTYKRSLAFLFSLIIGLALFGGFSLEAFAEDVTTLGTSEYYVTVSGGVPITKFDDSISGLAYFENQFGNFQSTISYVILDVAIPINIRINILNYDQNLYYFGRGGINISFDGGFSQAISDSTVNFQTSNILYIEAPDGFGITINPTTAYSNASLRDPKHYSFELRYQFDDLDKLLYDNIYVHLKCLVYNYSFDTALNSIVDCDFNVNNFASTVSSRVVYSIPRSEVSLSDIAEAVAPIADILENDNSGISDNLNSEVSSAAAVESAADGAISNALPDADDELDSILDYNYSSLGTDNLTALSFWKQLGDYILSNSNLVGIGALLVGCLFLGFVIYLLRL